MNNVVEIGVILPETKEHLGLPEAGETRKDSPTKGSEKAWFC